MPIARAECGDNELGWDSERGKLRIRRPAKDVVLFVETGFLEKGFAPLITDHLDAALGDGARPEIFVDAYDLDGYDPEVRVGSTNWLKQHHELVRKQHMLVRSRLTKMGLSVASMTLGGVLVGHSDRATFQREYRRAVSQSQPPPKIARS